MSDPLLVGLSAGATAVLSVHSYGMFWPRSCLFGKVIGRGDQSAPPRVALTFDDGPHETTTPRILDRLAEHHVKAAFFMIGANAEQHPHVVEQVHAQGHLVANHSYDHPRDGMFRFSEFWRDQLERTDKILKEIIGQRPALFRPPMGFKHRHLAKVVKVRGQQMVTWTRRAFDGLSTSHERIVDRLSRSATAGDILTLHDGCEPRHRRDTASAAHAIDPLIHNLRGRGLEPVRLDELIDAPAYLDEAI